MLEPEVLTRAAAARSTASDSSAKNEQYTLGGSVPGTSTFRVPIGSSSPRGSCLRIRRCTSRSAFSTESFFVDAIKKCGPVRPPRRSGPKPPSCRCRTCASGYGSGRENTSSCEATRQPRAILGHDGARRDGLHPRGCSGAVLPEHSRQDRPIDRPSLTPPPRDCIVKSLHSDRCGSTRWRTPTFSRALTILLRAGHGAGVVEPIVRWIGDGHRLAHDSRVFCMAF